MISNTLNDSLPLPMCTIITSRCFMCNANLSSKRSHCIQLMKYPPCTATAQGFALGDRSKIYRDINETCALKEIFSRAHDVQQKNFFVGHAEISPGHCLILRIALLSAERLVQFTFSNSRITSVTRQDIFERTLYAICL